MASDKEGILEESFQKIEEYHNLEPEGGKQFKVFKDFAEALNKISSISAELGATNAELIQQIDACFEKKSHDVQCEMAKAIGEQKDCFFDFGFKEVYDRLSVEYNALRNELPVLLRHEAPRPNWYNFVIFGVVAATAMASWVLLP